MLFAVRIRYPAHLVWSEDTLQCRQPLLLPPVSLFPFPLLILKSGLLGEGIPVTRTAATDEQPDTAIEPIRQPERVRDDPPEEQERGQQELSCQLAGNGQEDAHKEKAAPQKQGGHDQAEDEQW